MSRIRVGRIWVRVWHTRSDSILTAILTTSGSSRDGPWFMLGLFLVVRGSLTVAYMYSRIPIYCAPIAYTIRLRDRACYKMFRNAFSGCRCIHSYTKVYLFRASIFLTSEIHGMTSGGSEFTCRRFIGIRDDTTRVGDLVKTIVSILWTHLRNNDGFWLNELPLYLGRWRGTV